MHSARTLAVALVVMASACGNKKEATPTAGSATQTSPVVPITPTGPDPFAKTDAPTAVAAAPCNDDDIKKHIADGLGQSAAYLSALERRTARWKKDCEAAKQDLLALEADATKFMDAMLAFKAWGETLSPACRKRVEELGEQSPVTADLEKRTPTIEARVKPMLESCTSHPGFEEAAAKGLRVLRKKAPAQ